MKNALAIAGAILAAASALPYIVNILRGKTHPNLVTWVTWTLLATVQTLADWSAGADRTAILAGSVAIANGIIFVLALSRGVKKYTRFDFGCQLLAVVAFFFWRTTGDPNVAVALSWCAILIAALPTYHHAFVAPYAETWENFAIGGVAGILTILSLDSFSFAAVALPIMTLINAFVMTTVVLSRRRQFATES
jgi:hypothetical protein